MDGFRPMLKTSAPAEPRPPTEAGSARPCAGRAARRAHRSVGVPSDGLYIIVIYGIIDGILIYAGGLAAGPPEKPRGPGRPGAGRKGL